MNRLKFLREEKGLFQSDIAKILGVSIAAVGFYVNEKRDMSPDTIIKLAEYFDVTTDYLLGKSDIRNPEEIKNIPHANAGGVDTTGLDEDDLKELQAQIDYMKWKKNNK
mgnify:CR=1 FL=1